MNNQKKRDHKVARGTKYLLPPLSKPSVASRRQQRRVAFVSKMSSPPFAFETMEFLLLRVTFPFASKLKSYQMTAAASFYQRINSIKFCKKMLRSSVQRLHNWICLAPTLNWEKWVLNNRAFNQLYPECNHLIAALIWKILQVVQKIDNNALRTEL